MGVNYLTYNYHKILKEFLKSVQLKIEVVSFETI